MQSTVTLFLVRKYLLIIDDDVSMLYIICEQNVAVWRTAVMTNSDFELVNLKLCVPNLI